MHERIVRHVDMRRVAWAGFALVVVAALALFVHGTSPAVRAQSTSDDCFGGALAEDSIHCEVFEWAHNTGVIEVDAVYRAGNALYIYLTQSDRLDDAALQEMLGKSQEVARRTGEHDCVLESLLCASGELGSEQVPGYILPKSPAYDVIEVFPGGAEARRSSPGWQAFQQFWPEAAEGASGATGTGVDFDISGVDRTNFPTLAGNCGSLVTDNSNINNACRAWDYYPGLRVANRTAHTSDDKVYYYVKASVGEEETKVAAAKTALMNSQPDYFTEDHLVVVAVPHDFEELWRWSLVLDRFANSSGNTLGITLAELEFNTLGGRNEDRKYVFPTEDAPDLTGYIKQHGGFVDGSRWRLIIHVKTLNFEGTVAGLPRLLGQLEIPESAVGLIYELKHENPGRGEPVPGPVINPSSGSAALPGSSVALGPAAMPWWTWAAAGAAVLVLIGLGGLVAFRLRSAAKGGSVR